MLGGAPGIGKSAAVRRLLELAQGRPSLVQWVDIDSLWLHQPWRVDERMTTMMRANLRSVAGHAAQARVDVLVITWVFQSAEMHHLVTALLPPASRITSVQLHASHETWSSRFEADPERPSLDDFYQSRYAAAQVTPADYIVETDGLTPIEIAHRVAALVTPGNPGA